MSFSPKMAIAMAITLHHKASPEVSHPSWPAPELQALGLSNCARLFPPGVALGQAAKRATAALVLRLLIGRSSSKPLKSHLVVNGLRQSPQGMPTVSCSLGRQLRGAITMSKSVQWEADLKINHPGFSVHVLP